MREAKAGVEERIDLGGSPANLPWPSSAGFGPRGLELGGVVAADLASRFGTPLVVVDEEDFRARCQAAAASWPRAFYALKAFTSGAAIRIAVDEGLDLLAASGGEVEACLRAGIPASRISLHGNDKSDAELDLVVETGVGLVVLDSLDDVGRLSARAAAAGRVVDVLVRVIPEVEADTHEAIATGHARSKFGVPLGEVVGVARAANEADGLHVVGLHAHVGSQVLDAEPYGRVADVLVGLAARLRDEAGIGVELLDVGGGFGIVYEDERPADPGEVARIVLHRIAEGCAERGLPAPTVAAEPGRSLIGPAGVTLYRVGAVKRVGGRRLVAVDGGMSDNPRPALYGARYTVAAAGASTAAASSPATVVGRHCESGDVLAEDVALPDDLARGDLLAFAATGAYTHSMASTYNRVGRPAVVGVRSGEAHLWLRREDAADLDRLEAPSLRDVPSRPLPDGIAIRPATPRDAVPFRAFWSAIVAEERFVRSEEVRHSVRTYRRRFRRPWTEREAQILAVEGRRVVGHVYIAREDHPVTSHVATLGIAVAADRRGRGVGTTLLAEAFRWARGVGIEKVVLSVYPHNAGAIALYRRFGFVEEGRLVGHSRKRHGYEDEVMMATWIRPPR